MFIKEDKKYACNIYITIEVYYKFKGRMISKHKRRGTKATGQEHVLVQDKEQVQDTK